MMECNEARNPSGRRVCVIERMGRVARVKNNGSEYGYPPEEGRTVQGGW